jgi:hypothetical protein
LPVFSSDLSYIMYNDLQRRNKSNKIKFIGIFSVRLKISAAELLYKNRRQNVYVKLEANFIINYFLQVTEKVMHKTLCQYLQTNNILVPEQAGFRKGISTENAAFKVTVY